MYKSFKDDAEFTGLKIDRLERFSNDDVSVALLNDNLFQIQNSLVEADKENSETPTPKQAELQPSPSTLSSHVPLEPASAVDELPAVPKD